MMILRVSHVLLMMSSIYSTLLPGVFPNNCYAADLSRFVNQSKTKNDSLKAISYLDKSRSFGGQRLYDSAAYFAQKSLRLSLKNQWWDHYQMAGTDLALYLLFVDKLDSAGRIGKVVSSAFEKKLTSDSTTYARLLNIRAGIYNMTKKLDSAIIFMDKLIQLDKLLFKDSLTLAMAGSYNNMGAIYTDYQVYEKALKYYDSAMAIHQELSQRQSEYAARVYSNKAIVLKASGKFEESLEHNRQSFEIFKNILPADHPRLALSHFNIANDLVDRNDGPNDITMALDHLGKGEKILLEGGNAMHVYMIDFYRYSAKINQKLKQYGKAVSLFKKAINLNRKIYGDRHADIGIYKEELAELYRIKGDLVSSESELKEALNILEEEIGKEFKNIALVYSTMGSVAADKKEYKRAVALYNKAVTYFAPDTDFSDPLQNPPLDQLVVDQNLFGILQKKSDALWALYKADGSFEYLQATLNSYVFLSDYIRIARKAFFGSRSKLKFNEAVDKVYQKGIAAAIELYKKTKKQEALQQGLLLSDAYKSGLLLDNIEDNQAKVFANISQDLLDREAALKASIDFTKKRIFELKNDVGQSNHQLRDLNAKQFLLKAELENLSKTFESQYPTYHQIKYNPNQTVGSLKTNLVGNNQCLIQYFIGDSLLYIFGLTNQGIIYQTEPWKTTITDQVYSFLSATRKRNFDSYVRDSFALYKILLKGILDQINKTNQRFNELIIIPDGILGYIPFEILIKEQAKEQDNYLGLEYLIKYFDISYHYSANLLTLDTGQRQQQTENGFVGFAPEFSGVDDTQLLAFTDVERSYLDSVSALPQAKLEVEVIANILGGVANVGDMATEYNFKQQSAKAGIIHLASHSLINDEEPLYSKLIFDSRNDTIEDGLLHTYELYNMKLNADLACLSACNTRIGKYYHGEGIVSLARGFMYAGVPNVMMSLWPVSDQSTRDIMQFFYEELVKGTPKSKALRKAKLKYLEQADPISANPYYWGGFIFLGEINKTSAVSRMEVGAALLAGLLVVALIVLMLKRRFGKPSVSEQH